jgi:hypothetical protein
VFADANNCSNTLEEQYHQDILTLRYKEYDIIVAM